MPYAKLSALPRLAAVLALFTAAACGEGRGGGVIGPPPPPPVASVAVTAAGGPTQVGSTVQFSATARDAAGNALTGREMAWASSDTMIATVDATGLVKAKAPGSAAITATSEGKAGSATAQVIPIPVAAVAVTPSGSAVIIGTTQQMEATTRDANGNVLEGRAVAWSSSDPAVATVSGTGLLTAHALGGVLITATSEGKSATVHVAVMPVPVATLSVELSPAAILPGASATLRIVARDAAGNVLTGRPVAVGSSNMNVAVPTSNSVVTGIAEGRATITATAEGKSASAEITVLPVPVATLSVSVTPATIQAGSTGQLTIVARDARGNVLAGRAATVAVANGAVASVDANRVVSALAPGTTAITVTSESITASTNLTVVSGPPANLVIVSGDGQTQPVDRPLLSLVVRVTDRLGHPVYSTGVTFVKSAGNFTTPDRILTNEDGRAKVDWVLPRTAGQHTVTASLSTAPTINVTFRATAVPGPIYNMAVQPDTVVLPAGGTRQMVLTASDAFFNEISTANARWYVSLEGNTSVSTTGVLRGLVRGNAVVTAELSGRTAQAPVWVYTGTDVSPPTLSGSFSTRPTPVDARFQAVAVTLNVGLGDTQSGVKGLEMTLLGPGGVTRVLPATACRTLSGLRDGVRQFSCGTLIAAGSPSGTWVIQSITAEDYVGNKSTFNRADIVAKGGESSFQVVGQ